MFVRARCAAAILAGVALLAGCSGSGSSPRTLPSLDASTGSPSASPSPTSTASELAAASAVVRRYYELLNRPTSLANAADLARLMTGNCACREVVTATLDAVRKSERFFGTNRVLSLVPSLDGASSADVLVTYDYTRSGLKDSAGRVVSSGRGHKGTTQDFRLIKLHNEWLIAAILRVSAGTPA